MTAQEGMREFKEGNYEKAAPHFREMIESDDKNHKAWNALGICLSKTEHYEDACICFENARTLDPNNDIYQKNWELNENKKPKKPDIDELLNQLSDKELYFLLKCYKPRLIDEFVENDAWNQFFKESPKSVIKRLCNIGVLKILSYEEFIFTTTTIEKLKPLLKERGLPISGKKQQLIDRLIEFDPDNIKSIFGENRTIQCTEKGQELVNFYREKEKERKMESVKRVSIFLQNKDYSNSIKVSEDYHNCTLDHLSKFGENMTIVTPKSEKIEILKIIDKSNPKYLKRYSNVDFSTHKLMAQLKFLFNDNDSFLYLFNNNVTTLTEGDNISIPRIFYMHALYIRDLNSYKESGFKYIEYLGCNDSCPSCQKIQNKKIPISKPIELPYEHCTCEYGCRCSICASE